MMEINLGELTGGGEVRNLSGHQRGLSARERFHLADKDASTERVVVVIPTDIYSVSPSFFQGMFAESVKALGSRDSFMEKFDFRASPLVMRQIENGITASLMKRKSFFQ